VFLILNICNNRVVYNISTLHCDCGLSEGFMNPFFLSDCLCCIMFLSDYILVMLSEVER